MNLPPATRRQLMRYLTVSSVTAISLPVVSKPVLAVEGADWNHTKTVSTTTTDGTISDIKVDEQALDFTLQYQNLTPGESVTASIEARLYDQSNDTGKYAFEEIMSGSYTVPDSIGTATEQDFSWTGLSNGLITTHSSLTSSDFTATSGETNTTKIELRIEFAWKNVNEIDYKTYNIEVTNNQTQPPTNGLLSHWKLNGDATDTAGSADGSATGGVTYPTVSSQQVAAFDNGALIGLPPNAYTIDDTVTLSLWVKLNSWPSSGKADLFYTGSWGESIIRVDDGNWRVTVSRPTPGWHTIAGPTVTSNWTHVLFTYDGSTLTMYINGTEIESKPATGSLSTPSSSYPPSIGASDTLVFGNSSDSQLRNVRIYNRGLSASEVQAVYNAETL